ncbi:Rieske (2Fe-2S) protein [Kitasatospora sp. NPDC048540]|uniref:Rieske (2Fe-2S) protein n=1 Tax=unclassified Kitasatospora TaxID=2633591 RepID=UPI00068E1318|nr:Rieske (2Fe-2S) protein [Kitasatospora sp. MBT63]
MSTDTPTRIRQVTEELVLVELSGRRVLVQASCPHRKGRLLFGYVDERNLRIRCPLHSSTFDLDSGRRTAGPACDPLRVVAVVADGSDGTDEAAALAGGAR